MATSTEIPRNMSPEEEYAFEQALLEPFFNVLDLEQDVRSAPNPNLLTDYARLYQALLEKNMVEYDQEGLDLFGLDQIQVGSHYEAEANYAAAVTHKARMFAPRAPSGSQQVLLEQINTLAKDIEYEGSNEERIVGNSYARKKTIYIEDDPDMLFVRVVGHIDSPTKKSDVTIYDIYDVFGSYQIKVRIEFNENGSQFDVGISTESETDNEVQDIYTTEFFAQTTHPLPIQLDQLRIHEYNLATYLLAKWINLFSN